MIAVKLARTDIFGFNLVLDIFLGSSPSFVYLFGMMSVIPIVQPKINVKTFHSLVLMLSLYPNNHKQYNKLLILDFLLNVVQLRFTL
ncbi:hypothetical protein D5R81_17070 [Parashewanella spongiae]|uniref:Uncharacterized protein n=1 Tax=Parashewanella spongiae TaxID=342950 RepID=A0A3A6TPB7_9GAMM|nr:hypothetical protein D5R81_17070 [Parashewanella spongiae]